MSAAKQKKRSSKPTGKSKGSLFRRRARVVPVVGRRRARQWRDASADDTASRLHWLYLAHRDVYVAKYYAKFSKSYPYPAKGFPRAWRWYLGDVLIPSIRLLRDNGAFVRDTAGVSRLRQCRELLAISTTLPAMPENYYKYELYRPHNRERAGEFLHRHETKGALFRMMTGEHSLDKVSPLTDKTAFTRRADSAGLPAAGTLATASDGEIDLVVAELPKQDLFVKPWEGRGGSGAQVWEYRADDDSYCRVGKKKPVPRAEFADYLAEQSRKRALLVQPRLQQNRELSDIALDALPTCRVITMTDESGAGEAVIAVFRMAAKPGSVVDNIHAGGISAPVDLKSGTLGKATDLGLKPTTRHSVHPHTGGQIEGRKIPMWNELLDVVARAHETFAPRKIVGWDVSVGPDGPVLVEGNSQPCVDLLQRPHDTPLGSHRFGELMAFHVERTLAGGKSKPSKAQADPTPRESAAEEPNDFSSHLVPKARHGFTKQTELEMEALRAGLSTRRHSSKLFTAEQDGRSAVIGFNGPQSSQSPASAAAIATHKGMTRELLAERGLPVPQGVCIPVEELDTVHDKALELGFPLVVKPTDGIQGDGVTAGVTDLAQLDSALERALESGHCKHGVIVERFVTGNDYRMLATPKQVLSVVRREPAAVVGDGEQTVSQLVAAANAVRDVNPYLGRHPIPTDERVVEPLRREGLQLDSVPEAGRRVPLSTVANLSQGGYSREVMDTTHPSVLQAAVDAVAAIPGLPYGGVDIFLQDHRRPIDEQDAAIIEINHNPALMLHHYPKFGPPRPVCEQLVRDTAEAAGLSPRAGGDTLTVGITVTGKVQQVGYRQWTKRLAGKLGIHGWAANSARADQVHVLAQGPARHVMSFVHKAFSGPTQAEPQETYVQPLEGVTVAAEFDVKTGKRSIEDGWH